MKFTLAQTGAHVSPRNRARGFAYALALPLLLLCATQVRAQEAATPAAPETPPAAVGSPVTPGPGVRRAPLAQPAARVVRPAAVAAPPAGAQTPTPASKVAPALAPVPPRQVVTVVHRMRGWKLLAWLATTVRPSFELDELPSPTDVHTNIVAGYISDDGRTVVARLPQTGADLDFPVPSPNLFEPTPQAAPKPEPEYTVITFDGRSVEAKFVGLDATTGLSLLETSSALLSRAPVGVEGDTDDPAVGQRILIYTPAPAPPARAPALAPSPGFVYFSIYERKGRLTEVRSGPSGRPFRLVAQTPAATDEWIGSVVANEIGDVIGIVSQAGSGGTQIVPMATALGARERVMKLRASAPQPWVGIRGEAAFQRPLEAWVGFGWKPEAALPLMRNGGGGVFLTDVAPGGPASAAGLKPGDLISRIGARDVRTAEDLSLTLKEAGVGSSLDFTVRRALEPEPLKFTVRLAATLNPAQQFEDAEWPAGDAPGAAELVNALDAAHSLRAFGVGGLRMTRRGAARMGARGGMLVIAVRPGSPAASCGLRAGDIIETANGAEFAPAELRRMLANRAAEPVSLGVVRGGARTNITYKYAEGSEP